VIEGNKLRILVGSLKYNPISKSHICAFGKQCESKGYTVNYIFSHEHKWMLSNDIKKKSIFIGHSTDIFSIIVDTLDIKNRKLLRDFIFQENPDYIYLHYFHPLNIFIFKQLTNTHGKTIYHAHEPYVKNKPAYGGIQQYWLYFFEYLQGVLLKYTDIAIISSKKANNLFKERYLNYKGKKIQIPLMYEDLNANINKKYKRKYITFIGPPITAKGPKIFLNVIDKCNQKNRDLNYLLISRKKITGNNFNKKNLKIFYENKISDLKIGNLLKQSIVTITPYKRATQSSVILVSYMYGTPVLSSNISGLKEVVKHKKTGYLVDDDSDVDEWIKGLDYIIDNNIRLSKNCRNYFLEIFSESNWKKYIDVLLE